ncbi:tape measure protein [Chryseobacterium arthrosphaerae]|uniref:Tape measure protein n=1 Tax=Chryseobacterium arthrosphaerae TaxID=651561 RepID=A0ABU7R519_9FLAO
MPDKLAILQAQVIIADLKNVETAAKSLNNTFKETVKQTDKISKAFNTGRIREYTAAIRELNAVTTQHTNIERQLADAIARTTNLERQQARLQTEQARTRRELAEASRAESRARQEAAREAAAEERQNRNSSSAHRQLTREVREARQKARDYGAEMINLKEKLRQGTITQREYSQQMTELRRKFRESTNEAIRLERQLRQLNQSTLPSNQRNGALAGRVTDIIKGVGIVSLLQKGFASLTNAAYKMGAAFYDTAVKLETLRFAQKAVFKTNEEVAKQNVFLSSIANKYGLEIMSLTDAYNKFSASSSGTSLEGERSRQIFDAVAKSSAMLGVSTEDTAGVLRALGQMMSKGKVQAEELRGQLGDRMAGAFRLFADGMGVSTAQLDKMLKDGKVITEEVLPKFADQLNKKYNLGIEGVDTKQADIARIKNEWTDFVDAVENKSGIVAGGINMAATAIVTLLQALKPSKEVTVIEQQQLKLNELGIQLRQNWNDENKRKQILDEIIQINPFFLNGLDKEKVTLEEIAKRIQDVNVQYVQKIALQEQEDKIRELVKDQALNYRDLAQIINENAVAYNALSTGAKNALDQFSQGAINYDKAYNSIISSTKAGTDERRKALSMLKDMNLVFEKETWHGFNRVRGIKDTNSAIKGATTEYNNLVMATNKMLGVQGQLIHMNGLTAQSFNKVGDAIKNQRKAGMEIIKAAQGRGDKHVLLNNVWRSQKKDGSWFTTDKKETDGWYMENGELVKRKPATLPEKETKPKAATLTAAQKDFVNIATGQRDTEIALLKEKRLDLLIDEQEYWIEYENIVKSFSNKIQAYLKGSNAKEIQVEGSVRKKAIEAIEQSTKELYDIRAKQLEENSKKEQNILERSSKEIDQSSALSDVEKLNKQIENDSKMIAELEAYYSKQIKLAGDSAQSVIEWERKRDEEIGKIEDQRLQRLSAIPEAVRNEIEYQNEILTANKGVSYEKQRQLILTNKKLNAEERAYQLSALEKQKEIKFNDQEIERQRQLRDSIINRLVDEKSIGLPGIPTKEEIKLLAQYGDEIERLTSENLQNQKDLDLLNFKKIAKGFDPLVNMISSLGLNRISDQFTKMYQKILDEGKNFSMSTKEIFAAAGSVIADFAQKFTNAQKEKTISALDEQLKYSQDATEQELGFINSRLEALNSLEELTAEQAAERNRLEDEARVYKDQQRQREKLIETQKARAEQKAAAQQALINAALAATMALATQAPPASYVMAGLSLAFGIAQSVSIMSKDPVPKYWKGRKGGVAEYAITQDRGREIIADEDGRIKSLGSDTGDKMTWLDKGDTVYTADETKHILKTMGAEAKIGNKVFSSIARQSMIAPQVSVVNHYKDNSDAIAEKVGKRFEQTFARYDKPAIVKINGFIYLYQGANHAVKMGTYDLETGKETLYGAN